MNRLAGRVRDRINLDASCYQAMLLMFCRCDPFDRDAVERKAEERPESEGRNANCRVRCNLSLCVFVGQVFTGKKGKKPTLRRAVWALTTAKRKAAGYTGATALR